MFSSAERCGNRLKLWNTKPMWLRSRLSSAPAHRRLHVRDRRRVIAPELISSSRLTVRISVDLPEPDGPQTTTTSPRFTSALMSIERLVVAVVLVDVLEGDHRRALPVEVAVMARPSGLARSTRAAAVRRRSPARLRAIRRSSRMAARVRLQQITK